MFEQLPADNFGVQVNDEKDARRLLWLANKIGEKKLRASAAKRNKYYPDAKLFVSVLLKRFQLKVPVHVFAPVRVKIFAVYVLRLRDDSAMKVGFTGDWPGRAYAYANPGPELSELFDMDRSVAIHFDSKVQAMRAEAQVKKRFAAHRVESPFLRGLIPFGCYGHTEWLSTSQYADVLDSIAAARWPAPARATSLAEAILHAERFDAATAADDEPLM